MKSVTKAVQTLMIAEPFYGIFASGLARTWSTQVDHAGIAPDGLNYKLLINKSYWESLDLNHRLGLIKHNLLHMCFFHVTDYTQFLPLARSKAILEAAMDLEVASYLPEEWWPDDAASRIFRILPNLPKGKGTKYYISVLNKIECGLPLDNLPQLGGEETAGVLEALALTQTDHNNWGSGTGEHISLVRTQIERRLSAAAQANVLIPKEMQKIVNGLLTIKKPIFNWKRYFRNFLANAFDTTLKSTRRKESLRFPGSNGHKYGKKHNILVCVDTSGSIGQKELDEFFSEIYHVWKAGANVDIIEFDTKIQAQYRYKGKAPANVKGRGGTNFQPPVDFYNQHRKDYTVGICFTDGYASHNVNPANNWSWVITSNGDQNGTYPGYKICIPKIVE